MGIFKDREEIILIILNVCGCISQMSTVEYGFPTIGGLMPVSGASGFIANTKFSCEKGTENSHWGLIHPFAKDPCFLFELSLLISKYKLS